jgi:hypothetical protein
VISSPGAKRSRAGRPRLGDERLDITLPRAIFDKLRQVENETGKYRTRIAAEIIASALIGGVVSR